MRFPTLIMDAKGKELLEKFKKDFPNNAVKTKIKAAHLDEEDQVVELDDETTKSIETLREEIQEIVATIFASSATGVVPAQNEAGVEIPAPQIPLFLLLEAMLVMFATIELDHVKDTDLFRRAIHSKMHLDGSWESVKRIGDLLLESLAKEHTMKAITKH